MLYVWTKNYPQVVGTCSGHHGQLISQNCVLTKIRAEPPPPLKTVHLVRFYKIQIFSCPSNKTFSAITQYVKYPLICQTSKKPLMVWAI